MKRNYKEAVRRASWILCALIIVICLPCVVVGLVEGKGDFPFWSFIIMIGGCVLIQGIRFSVFYILDGLKAD